MVSLSRSRPPPPAGPPVPPPPSDPPGGTPDLWRAYLEHLCFVMALARSLGVRRPADREDVAHEVFAIAWEQLDRYDPAKGTVRAWLASITIHEAKNWRRLARNRLDHGAEPDEQQSPAHTAERDTADAEVRALARELAEELPEELRLPLELIDFHELTHEEAASALRVPQSTLSSRYYKARSEYKKKIDRLRAKKQFCIDDLRGVAIPVPATVDGMFDALRTPDLAVDPLTADRIWERILSEPAPNPASGSAPPLPPPPRAASGRSREAPPTTSHGPRATDAETPIAALAGSSLGAGGLLSGAAKVTGAVLALAAAAAGGAGLHAVMTDRDRPLVMRPAPDVGAPLTSVAAGLPTGSASASATVASAPPVTAPPPGATAAAESDASLMDRMRAALGSRPGEVIALAAKHARLYPNKSAQEREALVILALARTGQRAEAQARAQAFRAKYPLSAYVQIIEAEAGGSGP